jgi:hypothetical protein
MKLCFNYTIYMHMVEKLVAHGSNGFAILYSLYVW